MKTHGHIKRLARHVPGAKQVAYQLKKQKIIEEQAAKISELHEAVGLLSKRNELWAEEVRELRGENKRLDIVWPVHPEEIIAADWRRPPKAREYKKHAPPYVINWVVPSMGPVSGGHADIFRAIHHMEKKGHICRVYFYDALKQSSLESVKESLNSYTPIKAELFYNAKDMADCDAVIATNWYTAYPVFNFQGPAKKFYFVQDFEPYFDPVGSYSKFAENTYRFGFYGITLGRWLHEKLSKKYGMESDFIEMGTDTREYSFINKGERKKILFYARPVTPRRGFEMGSLALQIFHERHPEYEIHCLGWDLSRYDLPFPFVNHGILNSEELNHLYNECHAGLVLSFTNMSLLPLEMLASGCTPVINDAKHTRMITYSDEVTYTDPNPQAIAEALHRTVSDPQTSTKARQAAEFAKNFQWDESNATFEKIITRELSR